MTGNPATDFSVALVGELVECGVQDIVLCPGSRSQALALAVAAFEEAGLVRLRVRIDERVAGFLALGLAVETRRPVAIITTSGTAVANLHPAVLEARHSGVPLILLTADRPSEMRGIGSNQTTDQLGIFGSAVGWCRDVEAPSSTGFDADHPRQLASEAYSTAAGLSAEESQPGTAGPVQLNLAFREPLSGIVGPLPRRESTARQPARPVDALPVDALPVDALPVDALRIRRAPNTVVIAGAGAGEGAEAFARALGVPLIAEVSSGSRFGPNLVVAYRALLEAADFGGRIERAFVFGHPTLSRQIPALLLRDGVAVHIVRGHSFEAYNPGRRAASIDAAVSVDDGPDDGPDGATEDPVDRAQAARAWLGSWVQAGRRLIEQPAEPRSAGSLAQEQLAVFRQPVTRRMLVDAVWRTTWPHDRLVLGASRLIREADYVVPGKKIRVHANRGLAGIDGTIATGIGIALASQDTDDQSAAGITRVLVGDLTALYDVGALLFGTGEPRPRIQVIVGNDGGGTIFDGLEVSASAPQRSFDRVLYTPQSVDLRSLAAAYGWEYRMARNRGELDESLAASALPTIVEVPLPR